MRSEFSLLVFLPFLPSCAESYSFRFEERAFPTQSGQRVILTTQRGSTRVRGVIGSRDIVVSGTVQTQAFSEASAASQARAVTVVDTSTPALSTPASKDPTLRLEVGGLPASGNTSFESEFLVPKDIRLEIHDGPENLTVQGLSAGVTIIDGAGDLVLDDIDGPVDIDDLDGDIRYTRGEGPVRITDRRGSITIEEVTGSIDLNDREDDVFLQSITGKISLAKDGHGNVQINNLDGEVVLRKWVNNLTKPVINTIWEPEKAVPRPATAPAGRSGPTPASGPAPSPAPSPTPAIPPAATSPAGSPPAAAPAEKGATPATKTAAEPGASPAPDGKR